MAWPQGIYGATTPLFAKMLFEIFLKSITKYLGEEIVANLQRSRGRGQAIFLSAPTYTFPHTPGVLNEALYGPSGQSKTQLAGLAVVTRKEGRCHGALPLGNILDLPARRWKIVFWRFLALKVHFNRISATLLKELFPVGEFLAPPLFYSHAL